MSPLTLSVLIETFTICKFLSIENSSGIFDDIIRSPELELRVKLGLNYDPSARPVKSPKTTVNITYKTKIYQLVGLKTKDQTIEMLMFQRLVWIDEFLQWDPRDYQGLEILRYYRNRIWTPDILPYNDVGSFDLEKYDYSIPIMVYYTGEVVWARPVDYESTCSLDVERFPFDTQECEVVIGSWQYLKSEVNFSCEPVDLSLYMKDSLWTLESKLKTSSNNFFCRRTYSRRFL